MKKKALTDSAESFKEILDKVTIMGGDNHIYDDDAEEVYVGLAWESMDMTMDPVGYIYVSTEKGEDHAIEEAMTGREEIWDQAELQELMQESLDEGMNEEDAWQSAYESMSEAWDFNAWTMPQEDFWTVIDGHSSAPKHL